jgi:hypothetical protein
MRKTGKMPLNQLSGNFQGSNILGLSSLLHIFFGPVGWILYSSLLIAKAGHKIVISLTVTFNS